MKTVLIILGAAAAAMICVALVLDRIMTRKERKLIEDSRWFGKDSIGFDEADIYNS
jgi:hypothetical protein